VNQSLATAAYDQRLAELRDLVAKMTPEELAWLLNGATLNATAGRKHSCDDSNCPIPVIALLPLVGLLAALQAMEE